MTDDPTQECCPPTALPPDQVEQQTTDYLEMLRADPSKAAELMKQWADTGLVITMDSIRQAIRDECSPIMETVEAIKRDQDKIAHGLLEFRAEVLALLGKPTQT